MHQINVQVALINSFNNTTIEIIKIESETTMRKNYFYSEGVELTFTSKQFGKKYQTKASK